MAFINTLDHRDDMQDDTYKIVAIRINQCYQACIEKNERLAKELLEMLYFTIDTKVKRDKLEELDGLFKEIDFLLYTPNIKPTFQARSKALKLCKKAYRIITTALDDKGILFRAEANINEMYKR